MSRRQCHIEQHIRVHMESSDGPLGALQERLTGSDTIWWSSATNQKRCTPQHVVYCMSCCTACTCHGTCCYKHCSTSQHVHTTQTAHVLPIKKIFTCDRWQMAHGAWQMAYAVLYCGGSLQQYSSCSAAAPTAAHCVLAALLYELWPGAACCVSPARVEVAGWDAAVAAPEALGEGLAADELAAESSKTRAIDDEQQVQVCRASCSWRVARKHKC